jgi:hypothetical protein
MMRYNEPLHLSSAADARPADPVRLAASAYLARFPGSSREHTESDLRCYLRWCADRGLDPLGSAVACAPWGEVELGGHAAEGVVGGSEEVVREAARHLADLVEAGQGILGQFHVETAEVAGELLRGSRAQDGDDPALGPQRPRRLACGRSLRRCRCRTR